MNRPELMPVARRGSRVERTFEVGNDFLLSIVASDVEWSAVGAECVDVGTGREEDLDEIERFSGCIVEWRLGGPAWLARGARC